MMSNGRSASAIHSLRRRLLRRAAAILEIFCQFTTQSKFAGRLDDLGDHMLRDIGHDCYQREEDRVASAILLRFCPPRDPPL